MTPRLAAQFQPLDRDAHIERALRKPVKRVKVEPVPMFSVDPTHRAFDGTDRMLDALEKLTEQRPCGCWIGTSIFCAVCRPT